MKWFAFRARAQGRRRAAAIGLAAASLLAAAGLLGAGGSRDAAAAIAAAKATPTSTPSPCSTPTLLPTPSLPLSTPTPLPTPCATIPTPTVIPTSAPSLPLPTPTALPISGLPTPSGAGTPAVGPTGGTPGSSGGSTGSGPSSGSGGSSSGAGASSQSMAAAAAAVGGGPSGMPPAAAQQVLGSLVVANPLLASETLEVLEHPISNQRPDLLHFTLAASLNRPGASAGGLFGSAGGQAFAGILLAVGASVLAGAGAALLLLGRLPRRLRVSLALAPIALALPLTAGAADVLTAHQAPSSQLSVATLAAAHATADAPTPTRGTLRAQSAGAPADVPAFSTLLNIENAISNARAQIAATEQAIDTVSTELREGTGSPETPHTAPHVPQPAVPLGMVNTLSALIQQHEELAAQYDQTLQQEYQYFVTAAQSPAVSEQLTAVLVQLPVTVQRAVDYDLSVVRTQLEQEDAITAASAAATVPGSLSATEVAQLLASKGPVSFQAPVSGVVTQPFGPTSFTLEPPITYNGVFYPHFHTGLDIAAPMGTPVGAAAAGVVLLATSSRDADGNLVGYGNYVVIRHANGYLTLYGHLEQLLVTAGEVVQQGQVIGLLGSTGWSTGPHVHFEIRVNGIYVDPAPFIAKDIRS